MALAGCHWSLWIYRTLFSHHTFFMIEFKGLTAYLFIDLSYSSSTWLFLWLHPTSWNDPLIRVPAAAHEQHLITHNTHIQDESSQQAVKHIIMTKLSHYRDDITNGTSELSIFIHQMRDLSFQLFIF